MFPFLLSPITNLVPWSGCLAILNSFMACNRILAVSCGPKFLDFPAEIRNQVYGYLCRSATPIRLYFYQDPDSHISTPVIPFASNVTIPVAFFMTCRQLNAEASSVFYSENIFLLNRRTRFASLMKPCFISALVKFLDAVGSRAAFIRSVVFETFHLYNSVFLRTHREKANQFLSSTTDILEVTVLLRQAWKQGLNLKVNLLDVADVEEERAVYWVQNPDLVRTTTVVAIINSLLHGQLSLNQYHDSVRAIAIRLDGSGGFIGLADNIHITSPLPSHPPTIVEFKARDCGKVLEF